LEPESPLEIYGVPPGKGIPYVMAITFDDAGFAWSGKLGNGRLNFSDVTEVSLCLGDADDEDRMSSCTIRLAEGGAFSVDCNASDRRKKTAEKRHAYAQFVCEVHRLLSPDDRARIVFKTDSKKSEIGEKLWVWGYVGSILAGGLALWLFGNLGTIFVVWVFFVVIWSIVVYTRHPRTPQTYAPDPLDARYLPEE
jgi:hypothetical protein